MKKLQISAMLQIVTFKTTKNNLISRAQTASATGPSKAADSVFARNIYALTIHSQLEAGAGIPTHHIANQAANKC
ncbi:hypothetical protein [Chromobacterium sp. IIBBL 290-4]|uniref:hypothetical protein n=1 Tax=Chromobacterium sp. IIBBL 290-4 TaxID=2953890 RepID=UPI0020B74CED|nr:hypothetical protein [Chromobacterium sp. IIBBL 290-4]UTH76586.1 hypothetical protein NKT35_11010 [Chromobacterium sp. IIBBL 290-4]